MRPEVGLPNQAVLSAPLPVTDELPWGGWAGEGPILEQRLCQGDTVFGAVAQLLVGLGVPHERLEHRREGPKPGYQRYPATWSNIPQLTTQRGPPRRVGPHCCERPAKPRGFLRTST